MRTKQKKLTYGTPKRVRNVKFVDKEEKSMPKINARTTHAGKKYELIREDNLLLLSKKDEIEIQLEPIYHSWIFRFTFEDSYPNNSSQYASTSELTIDKGIITINLNKWYADSFTENTKPFFIENKEKQTRLLIKVRVVSNYRDDIRNIIVNIWKEMI